jgi:hypothetical protein
MDAVISVVLARFDEDFNVCKRLYSVLLASWADERAKIVVI